MTTTKPKHGDRVRVVIEGQVHERHGITTIGDSNIAHVTGIGLQNAVSVEVLPPPEPEFQPGDVVRDALGKLFVRVDGYRAHDYDFPWLLNGRIGYGYHDHNLHRPLTPLVVAGQPVTP